MKNSLWNIISIIVILSLSIMAFYLYEDNRTSHNKNAVLTEHKNLLEANVAKIEEQKKLLEDTIARLSVENGDAMARIGDYSARVEAIQSEYKTNMEGLLAEKNRLSSQIAVFDRELSDKNSEIKLLKKSLKNIDKKLRAVRPNGARGTQGVQSVQGTVSLEPIVVTRPKNVSGKIIEVNKDYGFVVMDLGSDDGISTGDTLFVSRKKAMLGKIVVEETAPKYSAAKVLYKSLGDAVLKGDTVTN